MQIRPETPADHPAIAQLVTDAFRGAPHAGGNEAAIVARLRDAGALDLSLLADEAGALSGHIAASPVLIGGQQGWACIAPLSVAPARQRQGIGAALMGAAIERLRTRAHGIVLVGEPDYYRRFGFDAAPGLQAGDIPAEYVLALAFQGTPAQGEVAFHPAFGL